MDATNITKGCRVEVCPNLEEEMIRLGFMETDGWNEEFVGKQFTAYDVWYEDDEGFVTIDLCCEIPIKALKRVG